MKKSKIIRDMLSAGQSYGQIQKELGVANSTIGYHARKIGLRKSDPDYVQKRYDWAAVQSFYDGGHSIKELQEKFGMLWATINEARRRGDLRTDRTNLKLAVCSIFMENSLHSTNVAKRYIKHHKLIPYYCHITKCPLYKIENPKWCNERIVLHLDHINGKRRDHRLNNLRFLCPNCHSQTATYCRRKSKIE